MEIALVAAGGAVGALARYGLGKAIQPGGWHTFPTAIFVVNISGAFALGLLFTALLERWSVSNEVRTAITVGVLGAFTTFSTFSLDTLHLIQTGDGHLAALNALGSVGAGLLAVWLGQQLARI